MSFVFFFHLGAHFFPLHLLSGLVTLPLWTGWTTGLSSAISLSLIHLLHPHSLLLIGRFKIPLVERHFLILNLQMQK